MSETQRNSRSTFCCRQTSKHQRKGENPKKDTLLVVLCYIAFYSFLIGFCVLLLKGAIDSDKNHTLLWTFFVLGIFFVVFVNFAIKIGRDSLEKAKIIKKVLEAKKRQELDP